MRTSTKKTSRPARPGAPGGTRFENRRLQTRKLLDSALPLFLERGIEGVTIDEIVRRAGIAKGSFYRYFDDKAALVEALFAPVSAEVERHFAACARDLAAASTPESLSAAYRRLSEGLAGAIFQRLGEVRLYLQESRAPATRDRRPVCALAERVTDAAIELTHVAHRHRLLRPIDPRVSALSVVGSVEKLLFEVLGGRDLGDLAAVPDALISLVLDGLRI